MAPDPGSARAGRPAFAHASEAEMSRILDFYGVQWRYEPTTFPILWNLDGEVVESFSPDFYLPDFDLYLEMTTLKQSLVRKKNRKLRRLRELYPDIRIKLFYARDFRAMMLKYGRLALAESLTGTPGQLVAGELHRAVLAARGATEIERVDPTPVAATSVDPTPVAATPSPAVVPITPATAPAQRELRHRRRSSRRASEAGTAAQGLAARVAPRLPPTRD